MCGIGYLTLQTWIFIQHKEREQLYVMKLQLNLNYLLLIFETSLSYVNSKKLNIQFQYILFLQLSFSYKYRDNIKIFKMFRVYFMVLLTKTSVHFINQLHQDLTTLNCFWEKVEYK